MKKKVQNKFNIDSVEDIIVDIASRTSSRFKQKSFKSFDDIHHIAFEIYSRATDVSKAMHKKGSTNKDIQSKLKEVAVTCILGIEFLERDKHD